MIKWEKEHHLNLEGKRHISYVGDAEGIHLILGKDIALHAVTENQSELGIIIGKNERKLWRCCHSI